MITPDNVDADAPAPADTPKPLTPRSNLLATLRAGLRAALLQRPAVEGLRFPPGVFWVALLITVLCAFVQSYLAVDAPREFVPAAFESEGLSVLLTLLASHLLARAVGHDDGLWPIAILMTWAGVFTGVVDSAVYDHILPRWAGDDDRWYWGWFVIMVVWWIAILVRIASALGARASVLRRVLGALFAVGLMTLPALAIPPSRFWNEAEDDASGQVQDEQPPLIAETLFSQQPALLDRALAHVAPSRGAWPNLYFLAFAPDGDQDVFLKEIRYAGKLFETRFGTAQHMLMLSNNRQSLDELPMATATNLERALKTIGQRMDVDKDILFLFMTSHGSEDGALAVELGDLSFRDVSAKALAGMLKASGIRWKTIVISACYSGSFIDALKDDHTLIMTAARADRTSFGCADDADFTYFGRAYFQRALAHTSSFTDAFQKASALVAAWENRDRETHSEPQIASSPLIEAQLLRWRQGLEAESNAATENVSGGRHAPAATKAPGDATRNCRRNRDCTPPARANAPAR
jgi:hypothetical protein